MRRILVAAGLLAGCAVLVAGLALGQSKTTHEAKSAPVKGTEYHHLLMLDLDEAVQHAKALNHYARTHKTDLAKDVVTRHVDELSKNLEGVEKELPLVEEHAGKNASGLESQLSTIREEAQKARQDVADLQAETAKDKPEPSVIESKSKAIYTAMSEASEHHRQVMTKRGVQKPAEPKS